MRSVKLGRRWPNRPLHPAHGSHSSLPPRKQGGAAGGGRIVGVKTLFANQEFGQIANVPRRERWDPAIPRAGLHRGIGRHGRDVPASRMIGTDSVLDDLLDAAHRPGPVQPIVIGQVRNPAPRIPSAGIAVTDGAMTLEQHRAALPAESRQHRVAGNRSGSARSSRASM